MWQHKSILISIANWLISKSKMGSEGSLSEDYFPLPKRVLFCSLGAQSPLQGNYLLPTAWVPYTRSRIWVWVWDSLSLSSVRELVPPFFAIRINVMLRTVMIIFTISNLLDHPNYHPHLLCFYPRAPLWPKTQNPTTNTAKQHLRFRWAKNYFYPLFH